MLTEGDISFIDMKGEQCSKSLRVKIWILTQYGAYFFFVLDGDQSLENREIPIQL